jgi:hypothetical protein
MIGSALAPANGRGGGSAFVGPWKAQPDIEMLQIVACGHWLHANSDIYCNRDRAATKRALNASWRNEKGVFQ